MEIKLLKQVDPKVREQCFRKVKVLNFDFHKQLLKGNINIENVVSGYPGGGRNDPGLEFQVRLKRDELLKQLLSVPSSMKSPFELNSIHNK